MTVDVIPRPVSTTRGEGSFRLASGAAVAAHGKGAAEVAEYLADALELSVGGDGAAIVLEVVEGAADHPEGYALEVTAEGIRITAPTAAGLFWGVQTLRQLVHDGEVPAVAIRDFPRFTYRGAMLDVARHFFPVAAVTRYLDDIALLKLNHLHLHLTDDQGWRIRIDSWPELTGIGASTQVGGSGGGHYSKDDYREIVEYAASRFITIVPEIDMPGHTNAAMSAYPELTCDGVAPAPYEGIEVGFSSMCIDHDATYRFVDDVVRELAELTPGPYLHIGGDEALATPERDYLAFIARATEIAASHGKTLIGWHEMGRSRQLPPGTVGQYWSFTTPQEGAAELTRSFVEQGGRVIMSPADVIYLDIKYRAVDPLGLVWADGPTTVEESYAWDPADIVPGIGDAELLGVEAPIWTETLATIEEVEQLAFPRIASAAEIAWSPRDERSWEDFSGRLAGFRRLLDRLGIRHGP